MSNGGWIKLHRQILDCWVWDDDEPYTKAQAWMYLLICANHTETKIYFDGGLLTVERGQYITSIRKLADKFLWSRDKVSKFLKLLESDNMATVKADTKKTLITIVNYAKYQDSESDNRTQNGHGADTEQTPDSHKTDTGQTPSGHGTATDPPQTRPRSDTNNNDNNDNNDLKNEKNEKNIDTPLNPPTGEREHSYDAHTNVENVKHFLNFEQYDEAGYIKERPKLWECIKKWMDYKDGRKPRPANHYANGSSISTLLNKFVRCCKESGEDAVINAVDESIGACYQGIVWDKCSRASPKDKSVSEMLDEMKGW